MDVDVNNVKIEADYCPEAVLNWLHCSGKKRGASDLSLKAKKHLLAIGWVIWYAAKAENIRELRYKSPAGKVYYSLVTACKACISDVDGGSRALAVSSSNDPRPPESSVSSNTLQGNCDSCVGTERKRNFLNCDSTEDLKNGFLDHQDSELNDSKRAKPIRKPKRPRQNPKQEKKLEVQESNKRVRLDLVSSPANGNSRLMVLSWLIDNEVVPLGAKVNYRGRMAEGKVTREGIQCNCCEKMFTLTGFEFHAGSTNHRPAANILLEDGRSLRDCKAQAHRIKSQKSSTQEKKTRNSNIDVEVQSNNVNQDMNDHICSVCLFGGELVLCDGCPSSFHMTCIGLESFPDGDWFCPSCCCGVCKESISGQCGILRCDQCQQKCHISCLQSNLDNWFCSTQCQRVFSNIHDVLGKSVDVGEKNLTWTLLKSMESDKPCFDPKNIKGFTKNQTKLHRALDVMHECFDPSKDAYTGRDIVEDVIFSRGSELSRLNFEGFCVVVLEKKLKVVSVGAVRIHRDVAEIPLVATRFKNRRHGMCRILMNELEKQLLAIGVQRLVLPATPTVVDTWINSFGFSRMTDSERGEFQNHTFLDFQGTVMCHKFLKNTNSPNPTEKSSLTEETGKQVDDIGDEFDWRSFLNDL
ncbi:increased DNA methylation 1 [Carica papaya]|uniref:increased DNA methylation 1 n=1 Tax=Carica papaya TaxID=3649 RepID=UPI000B8C8B53|nr:increased DNA methylation 1 [Carica papaya]